MTSGSISETQWDDRLSDLGGHFLQSRKWADFKARQGWQPVRVTSDDVMAQLLVRRMGPAGVAYIPRGPAVREGVPVSEDFNVELDRSCRKAGVLYLIGELDRPVEGISPGVAGWHPGPPHIQPSRTVKIPLLDDDALLGQMHQKSRYSVRLAMRRGVEVVPHNYHDNNALKTFHELLRETSARNEFGVHDLRYYRDFMDIMRDDAVLLVASIEGNPAASLIAVAHGDEAIYMYGASSTEHRAHGAAFLLQFEAMKWARERGKLKYDLWGIPKDPGSHGETPDGEVPGSRGDDWRGLYRFKTRFGGEIIEYPPTVERLPFGPLSRLAKRYVGSRF